MAKRSISPARRSVRKSSASKKKTAKSRQKATKANASTAHPGGAAKEFRATIRVYRHGLGDCILVRLPRKDGSTFKLVIDCGVAVATTKAGERMQAVMQDIVAVTGNSIDVLAVTHEHWDHVSGFYQAKDLFETLDVGEVWLAWTEDPDDGLANKLREEHQTALTLISNGVQAMKIAGNHDAAEAVLTLTGMFGAAGEKTKAAMDIAKDKAKNKPRYLRPTDAPIELNDVDVRFYVLGPPHDEKAIKHFNPSKTNPETYELALDGTGVLPLGVVSALSGEGDALPFPKSSQIPISIAQGQPFFRRSYWAGSSADWRRVDTDWLGNTDEFALMLQSATNNTSLVLAIELADGGVLLFAGDAQVGNWLSWQDLSWQIDGESRTGEALLRETIFYKVGHHGSHNATMKEKGLDMMTKLETAIIPVDEMVAKKMRWGAMPLSSLVAALEARTHARTLRTDKTPGAAVAGIHVNELYFELTL
jgi:beta-lactamase superfamily II metal-dependent hydrolase